MIHSPVDFKLHHYRTFLLPHRSYPCRQLARRFAADCTAASIGSIFSSDFWMEKSSSRIRSTWSANSLIVLGGTLAPFIALKS
jgi:hypothetical protein